MCDLHHRLIARARAMGARDLSIRHGGSRGSPGRYRRHPHVVGVIAGQAFKFPIKLRPHDTSRHYRETYLRKFEAFLLARGGTLPVTADSPPPPTRKQKKRRRAYATVRSDIVAPVADWSYVPPDTRCDSPFACLAILRDRLAKSSTA